jgi:hypothetical protein
LEFSDWGLVFYDKNCRFIKRLFIKKFAMKKVELDVKAMVAGIGRKATDEELIEYLNKDIDAIPIPLEEAFAKYTKDNPILEK